MANLTDADKVLRNDTGKDIVTKLNNIATAIQTSGTTSLYVIADAFDSTATYDVGSYVIYNSSLYKCTTAVTVAGAFDPSDWETVQVMDEIPDNVAGAIAMTQAQWDAIVDKAAWRNAHKNSYLVITDAPNLNPTASDIEYSGAVTVYQAIHDITDIKTLVTFNENISGTNTNIVVKSGVLYIYYQGEAKAHNANDLLFTLPSGYRPSSLRYCTYNINDSAFGEVGIDTDGKCYINHISTSGANGRVYFAIAIPL